MLLERARRTGRVNVAQVSEELHLAAETIRRDLKDLERQGLVRRVYGGAVAVERLSFESALSVRSTRRQAQKNRIAASAVTFVKEAESVYIDEGFLPSLVAHQLPADRPLTVVTSSLVTAQALVERPEITVLVVGGRVRAETVANVDHWAVAMLDTLVLDLAFMGGNGMSIERGVTVPDGAVAAVKSAAMRVSRRRILIADSSKYGMDSFVRFAQLDDFERLVTDDGLPMDQAALLHEHGVDVTRA
ncbi:DeoR/GlpR family DNA-binding transcription regulator [Streptomyces sediminimaris]|uniref:DeoR/GlpR family DNA-binding transcription regulator n=1 Tax=Streptomyces sediminimaris TaxID=3383721 RepID=UPI00399A8C47